MALPGTLSDGHNVAVKDKRPELPPEEKFWKRYSPNHECSLSSVVSIILHVVFIGVLLLVAALVAKLGWREHNNQVALGAVALDPGPGKGGDNREEGASKGTPDSSKEDVATPKAQQHSTPVPNTPELIAPKREPSTIPKPSAPDRERIIAEAKQASDAFQRQVEEAMNQAPPRHEDPKARGEPDGLGKGVKGPGPGAGPAAAMNQQRINRRGRWQLDFRVANAEDHLRQLSALGAILAFPAGGGKFFIVRDLMGRPPRGKIEDVSKINRIWFIDYQPATAREIARVLHSPLAEPYFVAFFPNELENHMGEMEQKFRGLPEKELREKFRFRVVPDGGAWKVVPDENQ
jgi:hypothetical protein